MNKIKIKFANYALHDILRALKCCDVDEITITKEDNELVMYVDIRSYSFHKQQEVFESTN